ncbi:MAG: glycosyltransferase, partial [Acidobacteriota bacterium]
MADIRNVSVIIPTLNEAVSLKTTIDAVKALSANIEIIVVDGGSRDATISVAENSGALVVRSERGRGTQMHAGATAAKGYVLWFLHADTKPAPDSLNEIHRALTDSAVVAGNFTLRFAGEGPPAKFMTWFYRHIRKIGLL